MLSDNWGLMPYLFQIGKIKIGSYQFFMFLAIITGVIIYKYELKKENIKNKDAIFIVLSAITFGSIGAKIPLIFMYWDKIKVNPIIIILSGRTIVGALIGGFLGTFLAKKILNVKSKLGNQIAIPVAFAMAIGRFGCLLRGCCYGKPTSLFFGLDFGDHIMRYPTQVFEIIFDFLLGILLIYIKKNKELKDGELFKIFLTFYLTFRFFLEFIRIEKIAFFIFTDFQILCFITVIFINRVFIFDSIQSWRRKNVNK
mgnify:CR=1 FL=1